MRKTVLAAVLVLGVAAGALARASPLREAQLADLETAKNEYVMKSLAFTPDRRAEALLALKSLEARAGNLSDLEFLIGVAHLSALANNAHDSFHFGDGAWRPPARLPLRMMWFPDAMVVSRAAPQYSDILGARVVAIDGHAPGDIFTALGTIDGGTLAYRTWDAEWAVEYPSVLHALGLAPSADKAELQLVLPDGRTVERSIPITERTDVPSGVEAPRLWSGRPFGQESALGWKAANADAPTPLYLRDPDLPYRMVDLPAQHAVYVQLRSNMDSGDYKLTPFVQRVTQRLARHPRNFILDLRFDTGGNNELTIDLMRAIPQAVPGRIYLLTGRYTFSAGIASAAALKHAGGDRVTIAGEPVGDNLRWWSEGKSACLFYSRLCLHVTTGLWDLVKGCAGNEHCYGDKYDENVGSLDPQISAPLTAQAWLAGQDPGMDAVLRDLTPR